MRLCSSLKPEGADVDSAASDPASEAELEAQRQKEEAKRRRELERQALQEELAREKRSRVTTAVGSALAAVALFFYNHVQPVEGVTLLRQMQQESPALRAVVDNGRPTVVDFYAEWCENCKEMAPVLRSIEGKYKDKVNFVVVNGDAADNRDLVDTFRVDGIPHLALINTEGEVKTALIGKVPKRVLEADIDALIRDGGQDLPYLGYDAFEDEDHHVQF